MFDLPQKDEERTDGPKYYSLDLSPWNPSNQVQKMVQGIQIPFFASKGSLSDKGAMGEKRVLQAANVRSQGRVYFHYF